MSAQNINERESSAMQLLQEINSGAVDPKLLDKQSRQQCVEMLVIEGYTRFQIAQLLKRSEKTISRDMADVRRLNELTPNIEFAKQLVGEMFQKAMAHHNFLTRLTRGRETSTSEKIQSELAAWRILKELIERLQSLGYLPSQPKEIVGTFYNHSSHDDDNSPASMRRKLFAIEEAAKDSDLLDSDMVARIDLLRTRVDASEVAVEIKELEAKISEEKDVEE